MSDFTTAPAVDHAYGPARPTPAPSSRYTPPAPRVEAEAVETITVDWGGVTVTLPASVDDWDPDVLEAFEGGKAITALRALLGSTTYNAVRVEWKVRNGRAAKIGDMTALFEEIARTYGFDSAGE